MDAYLVLNEMQNPHMKFKGYIIWALTTSPALSLNTLALVHSVPPTLTSLIFPEYGWHAHFALCVPYV